MYMTYMQGFYNLCSIVLCQIGELSYMSAEEQTPIQTLGRTDKVICRGRFAPKGSRKGYINDHNCFGTYVHTIPRKI